MKTVLREKFKNLRDLLGLEQKNVLNGEILSNFIKSRIWSADSFLVYNSFGGEADTQAITDFLLFKDKRVYMPRISGKNLDAVSYPAPLVTNRFGIAEPQGQALPREFVPDAALVPLLAADRRGVRLGYGGGYYDRYLAGKDILKAGICFDFQLAEKLPELPHDIRLNLIITDKRIIDLRT